MEARRVETQQVARCTARQRDPATGRGTLTLRAAVSMVGMTASAHIDDLPLVGLATHDLLTCMQVIFGRLDHVELWLLPTECSAVRSSTWDALDDLKLFVSRYREGLVGHMEFGQTLNGKIQSVTTAVAVFVEELPAARAAQLASAATQLTWAGWVSVNLVLGLGDWRKAPAQPLDLRALLNAAFHMHQGQARDRGLELAVELRHSGSVPCVPEWLVNTVVGNLVSNAIKYTDRGRIVISSASLDDGGAEVSVTDTGIGMDAETLRTLTQPWVRAHQVVAEGRDGQGLGLTLANWAARAVGAHLNFSSELGVGTRASLVIPAGVR